MTTAGAAATLSVASCTTSALAPVVKVVIENFGIKHGLFSTIQVTLEITSMVGVVFGNTAGIAPGYRGSLGWRKLELSSESEYVFEANDSASNFFTRGQSSRLRRWTGGASAWPFSE